MKDLTPVSFFLILFFVLTSSIVVGNNVHIWYEKISERSHKDCNCNCNHKNRNNGNYNKSLEDITIANNIVMGSENNLVKYVDGNTNAGKITWLDNVFYPTGTATLTSDGSTFNSSEVQVIDPVLVYDGTVWKSTINSPKLNNLSLDLSENSLIK
mgnify:CR=1 FL=1